MSIQMKISIDKEKCIKCGLCAGIYPDIFSFEEDGIKIIKKEGVLNSEENKKLADDLDTAKISCPNRAITIEDEQTK